MMTDSPIKSSKSEIHSEIGETTQNLQHKTTQKVLQRCNKQSQKKGNSERNNNGGSDGK
jgi:hypothetical protein